MKKIIPIFIALISTLLLVFNASAQTVKIGYQTGIDPSKVALADGLFEKNSGQKIEWRRFDNGAEVIRALASGDIDIGNVGSTIVATAGSRKLPITTFLIAAELGTSEALIARNGSNINNPQDLIGKTIAVPFVSTSHYSLLAALKHWGIDRNQVKIINLRGSEIPAAWKRGDIDAAYVWEPALGAIKESGKVLVSSAELASWGQPTYDVWVVRNQFAEKNAAFLQSFSRTTFDFFAAYKANPTNFAYSPENLQKIGRVTGAKAADITTLLSGNQYPTAQQQQEILSKRYVQAIVDTAKFLKEQGKLDVVAPDYSSYATTKFLGI
jgi:taurine transport system substrate-binding protein